MADTKIEWSDKVKERFWSYVEIRGADECWPWKGSRFDRGYGQFRLGTKKIKAHRAAFELSAGALSPGYLACHSCDNPPCCNPAHLFAGTSKDNSHDRDKKCRGKRGILPVMSGEENPAAKLCMGQALEIRALAQSGVIYRDIAARYGISISQVGNIARGAAWVGVSVFGPHNGHDIPEDLNIKQFPEVR